MFVSYTWYVHRLTDKYNVTCIHQLIDRHTGLRTLVSSTFLGFDTEEYIRVIFLRNI
jgi:hypothetical protein